jgi:DNA repair exonuclease SbcCD ATPase subunit
MQCNLESELKFVEDHIESLKIRIGALSGKEDLLIKQISDGEDRLVEISHKKEVYSKGIEVLDFAQESVKMGIKNGFESVVTYALQFIFGINYIFQLDFGRRGNLQEVGLNVKTDVLTESYDPMDTSGGGVIDVVSIALRVAILELHKPKIQGPIILDESFKHLSREHLYQAGAFLNALVSRVGRQIIMITHSPELVKMADNAIEIKG